MKFGESHQEGLIQKNRKQLHPITYLMEHIKHEIK